ncbi:hypothetical protein BEN49_22340 [Hymenobacter coccineus]|uniref:Uncharacterized protein n=1 Tax=Hymenobacter coccineus TaxID=1908235 RepID=A0A1G1TI74_9BACT|nr:hypothetical protein BEN49_22340 [Hymenobacter coccineus]
MVALLSSMVLGGATGRSESPSFPPTARAPSPELLWAWQAFAKAVQTNDRPALYRLSTACIQCADCTGPSGRVPATTFWRKDARLIFTPHTKARLLLSGKLVFGNNDHNKGLFVDPCVIPAAQAEAAHVEEVLVLVLDIDPSTKSQGLQKSFNFVKTARGYQFCGYYTIP